MNLLIPKISIKDLNQDEQVYYHRLDNEPYGQELAGKVAEKLLANNDGLYHSHRDYCGLGLFIYEGLFTLATVYDGYGVNKVVANFSDTAEFIHWLAAENDQSMALYGEAFNNQTITKDRLEWYLEDNYSPVWNDYAGYRREKAEAAEARSITVEF